MSLGTDGKVGAQSLKLPLLKPCSVLCQLNSGLDNIDGVKAVFLERIFRLNQSRVGSGHKSGFTLRRVQDQIRVII